jgi:hypothetical protein
LTAAIYSFFPVRIITATRTLYQLGRAAVIDWFTTVLALISAVLVFLIKINSAWLVLAGGLIGLASKLLAT